MRKAYLRRLWTDKESVTYCWQHKEEFQASNLKGEWVDPFAWVYPGKLDREEEAKLMDTLTLARALGVKVYVVTSYATPIAWHYVDGNGVAHTYRVSQRFSVTTTKQQGRLWDA